MILTSVCKNSGKVFFFKLVVISIKDVFNLKCYLNKILDNLIKYQMIKLK